MIFTTIEFAIFFVVSFFFAILTKRNIKLYKVVLLTSSIVFYLFSDAKWIPLLIIAIVWVFITGKFLEKRQHKAILIIGIVFNLLILIVGKYFNFAAESIIHLLTQFNIPVTTNIPFLVAPFGVSYYIFKSISYLFDVYRGESKAGKFLDVANYLSFFPQIGAGPISRFDDFNKNLNSKEKYDYKLSEVLVRILRGILMKFVLSSILFEITLNVFRIPTNYHSLDLIFAGFLYGALIYTDFSGYSDLSIAISNVFGFKSPENFDSPYRSKSIQEFWKRWHMSLSSWLRDYLYIPLGGGKVIWIRKYFNLFITMVIGGLWHGAHLNFVIWGAVHGVALILDHLFRPITKFLEKSFIIKVILAFLTTTFLSFTWSIFAITDNRTLSEFFTSLKINWNNIGIQLLTLSNVAILVCVIFFDVFKKQIEIVLLAIIEDINFILGLVIFLVIFFVLISIGPDHIAPFIYFSF